MSQTFAASKLPIGLMYLGISLGGVLVVFYSLRAIYFPPPTLGATTDIPKKNWFLRFALLGMGVLLALGAWAIFGEALFGSVGILLGTFAFLT